MRNLNSNLLFNKLVITVVEELTMMNKKVNSTKVFVDVLNQYAKGVYECYNVEEVFSSHMAELIETVLDIDWSLESYLIKFN